MADINGLTEYLTKGMYTPTLLADPVYSSIQEEIPTIINQVAKQLGYTIDNLPSDFEGLLLNLVKKEIYWRLAINTAPDYDIEFEFTKLLKSQRFDHYIKLVAITQSDIDRYLTVVDVSEVTIRGREGTKRNHELSKYQNIQVTLSNTTATSVCLDWNEFDTSVGNFAYYDIFLSKVPIYDEYADQIVNAALSINRFTFYDLKRTKFRIENLTPNTSYYLTFIYYGQSNKTILVKNFTTLLS